jgi:hypothetical protein
MKIPTHQSNSMGRTCAINGETPTMMMTMKEIKRDPGLGASLAKFQIGETVGGKAEAGKWKERGEEVGTKASPHMAELGRSGRTPPSSQGLWLL